MSAQHRGFEITEVALDAMPQVVGELLGDHQLLWIRLVGLRQRVQQGAVGIRFEQAGMQGDIRVQGDVFLPGRRLDGGEDLATDAKLGESPERQQLVVAEIPYRLVEPDHPLLDDVLVIGSDQEVGTSFALHYTSVLGQ